MQSIRALLLLLVAARCSAFVVTKSSAPSSLMRLQAYELKPEPEGGEVLEAVNTIENTIMKQMNEEPDVQSDMGAVYSFWLKTESKGALIKELHTTVLKDASKKANFPGFRKGQVPPYALPQIRGFAVQESVIRTIQSTVEAYGLKYLPGSDGEAEVLEDIPEIAKGYKMGDDIAFTAQFKAVYDPELAKADEEATPEAAVEEES